MGAAIGLRDDFDAAGLRRLARATRSANQGRRLLALPEIYDGGSRSDAARIGVHPRGIESFELVPETNALRRSQIESGVLEFKVSQGGIERGGRTGGHFNAIAQNLSPRIARIGVQIGF